ncbi:MAG TPA: hypothetical protein VFU36_18380 [Jatrophihabitans sp.]|nr:hypothetical protein [Jatrophihabitans sp.]
MAGSTALFSALLFYFGYVSSRAQYAYFGIDVDTIGLSTQDYVMRSPQPLLAPLLVLVLLGTAGVLAHLRIRRRVAEAGQDDGRRRRWQSATRWAAVGGGLLLAAGVVVLLSYPYLQDWSPYALVTPLLLAVGTAVLCYAVRIGTLLAHADPVDVAPVTVDPVDVEPIGPAPAETAPAETAPADPALADPDPAETAPADPALADPAPVGGVASPSGGRGGFGPQYAALALAAVFVVANLFWATATIAQWTGRGLAHYYAARLDTLPSVIIDTQERLYLRDPGVQETVLPAESGQRFHYRYRHLRLLIVGHDRMFLVPDAWSPSDSTLLLPLDGSVRVQFQFQNVAP